MTRITPSRKHIMCIDVYRTYKDGDESKNIINSLENERISSEREEASQTEWNITEGEPSGKKHYGEIICCIPQCYNNNLRNKELSYYVIPKDK